MLFDNSHDEDIVSAFGQVRQPSEAMTKFSRTNPMAICAGKRVTREAPNEPNDISQGFWGEWNDSKDLPKSSPNEPTRGFRFESGRIPERTRRPRDFRTQSDERAYGRQFTSAERTHCSVLFNSPDRLSSAAILSGWHGPGDGRKALSVFRVSCVKVEGSCWIPEWWSESSNSKGRPGCRGLYSTRARGVAYDTRVEYNPWHPSLSFRPPPRNPS